MVSKLVDNATVYKILRAMAIVLLFVISYGILYRYYKPDPLVPHHLMKFMRVQADSNMTTIPEWHLTEIFEDANRQCAVRNAGTYGAVDANTVVIVILVHRDVERLRYLLVSLAQVRHISSAVLVFSHSYYDENINTLIQLIDFCMVLQIFYPKSLQVYPDTFPGFSDDAKDSEGVPFVRRANMTERKHHWWWTAHFVFEKSPWAHVRREMAIFMDEASYVLPDLLHVFRFAKRALTNVPDASVLALGRSLAHGLLFDRLTVDSWRPHYGKGIAFDVRLWRKISSLGGWFCEYDDTSWSHSLMHLFERFPRGRALMVASMAPRVVSTGIFRGGWHAAVYMRLVLDPRLLYPELMRTVALYGRGGKVVTHTKVPPKGNGGWRDVRDIELCIAIMTGGDLDYRN